MPLEMLQAALTKVTKKPERVAKAPEKKKSKKSEKPAVIEEEDDNELKMIESDDDDESSELNFNLAKEDKAGKDQLQIKRYDEVKEIKEAKPGKDEVVVEFEYMSQSEAYFHTIRAFLSTYLDGEEAEKIDLVGLADHICERHSIGQVVASPLDDAENPELMPELMKLDDDAFEKEALKYNSKRDVFGFSSILSISYLRKQHSFLQDIYTYVLAKAEKHCPKAQVSQLTQALNNQNVGLLLVERVINMPPQYVPMLHTELPADLAFTKKEEDIKDPREFNYTHMLVVSKYTVPV
jgi:protein BCP1